MSFKTIQQNIEYEKFVIDFRLRYYKPHSTASQKSFAEEISRSLNQHSKFINPKFFYDERGSQLFDQICKLPEYYLTRTEVKLLKLLREDLPYYLNGPYQLIELGSGSSYKTRLILDILKDYQVRIEYFPIDISNILEESGKDLLEDYENLHITGVIDTYEGGLDFIKEFNEMKNLIIFLGSSFGNFSPFQGKRFLHKINSTMKDSDLCLIGLDLIKEKNILEKAYDDSHGITSKFNLNVLTRINRELDANFDLNKFEHRAAYNEKQKRIEIYLRSVTEQSVIIPKANLSIDLKKDELIHTENSHKFSISMIKELMKDESFKIKKIWQDEGKHYALVLISKV